MVLTLEFSDDELNYLREKFDIDDEEDLSMAVWEMINTYMEL